MSGAIPPLPQYAFMAWCLVTAKGKLYLYLTFTIKQKVKYRLTFIRVAMLFYKYLNRAVYVWNICYHTNFQGHISRVAPTSSLCGRHIRIIDGRK
jgi:hypothetical protein